MGGWLLVFLLPSAVFWLVIRLGRLIEHGRPGWARRSCPTPPPDLARLAANLRRIDAQYRRTEDSDQPLRHTRLQALALAYDDVLCESCVAVGLPAPERPLASITRLETEAALAEAGLHW